MNDNITKFLLNRLMFMFCSVISATTLVTMLFDDIHLCRDHCITVSMAVAVALARKKKIGQSRPIIPTSAAVGANINAHNEANNDDDKDKDINID